MCHFHQAKTVRRYITKRPKLQASKDLKKIDGGTFSPLKILIKIHRGLSKSLKLKMVDDYLLNYKKNDYLDTIFYFNSEVKSSIEQYLKEV